jgi:purine-binding chemotaxis protein CheW
MRKYVTFRVGAQLVGVEILLVREINRALPATPFQLAARHVLGLVNLRGQIVTIFDLASRVGLTAADTAPDAHDVVLRSSADLPPLRARHSRDDLSTGPDLLGLRVDSIGDIVEADTDAIEPVVANLAHLDRRLLSGVLTLDQEILLLLNVEALASTE